MALNWEPAMSVFINMVNHNKAEVEIGIDIFAEQIGGDNYAYFFERNTARATNLQEDLPVISAV